MKNKVPKLAVQVLIVIVYLLVAGHLVRASACMLDSRQRVCEISPMDPPVSIRVHKQR